MNKFAVLSMDLEEWYHLDYFDQEDCDLTQSTLDGVSIYLDILNKYDVKSTFFVVSSLVKSNKSLLQKILDEGHEIGLHSKQHVRPLLQSVDEFKNDTIDGLKTLKDILPQNSIYGYRAPCFSMDRERLDVLIKEGLLYDSSKIEFGAHNLYGNLDVSDFYQENPDVYVKDGFYEFEVSTLKISNKNIPVSGGGYIRIFPWQLSKFLLKKYFKKNRNYFFYIHPFELSENYNIKLPHNTSLKTRMRFSIGRKSVRNKVHKLINLLKDNDYKFVRFQDIAGSK